jgi:hypothetical protein
MGPATAGLPVVQFPTPTITGTEITGTGTYSQYSSPYSTGSG